MEWVEVAAKEATTTSSWTTGAKTKVACCGGKGTSSKGLFAGEGTSPEEFAKGDSTGQNDRLKSDGVRP